MTKFDATNGAVSSADNDGRWLALQSRLESVGASVSSPFASRVAAGCELAFWSEDAAITISATHGETLVGYLCVVRKDGWLLGGDVAVKKANRRSGIATSMYKFAEDVMNATFKPCTPHSVHAAAFWENRVRNIET
ncbi:GNAT family N-acetyltransferase [Paraburkholderia caledonica]|jgi:hypothetical protein